MVNVANVANPHKQVNDGLKLMGSFPLHVSESYCSNPEDLYSLEKLPLSVSESSNRVNNLVGLGLSIPLTNLIGI